VGVAWEMGVGWRRRGGASTGLGSRVVSRAWRFDRERGTVRRRTASLRQEPAGCMAWWSDPVSDPGLDRVEAEGSAVAWSGQRSRWRVEELRSTLELWGELPSGLRVLVSLFDAVARWFVIVSRPGPLPCRHFIGWNLTDYD
jgi:hypothetical protein